MAKKLTLEESFDTLEELIEQLQSGDLTLEASFQKYEEGMKMIKNCNETIDKVEKKLVVIQEGEK